MNGDEMAPVVMNGIIERLLVSRFERARAIYESLFADGPDFNTLGVPECLRFVRLAKSAGAQQLYEELTPEDSPPWNSLPSEEREPYCQAIGAAATAGARFDT